MNRRQRKLLNLLLGLVALLLAVLLAVTLVKRRAADKAAAEAAQQAQDGVIAADTGYTALTYSNGTATLSFSQDEDGNWIWTDDPEFPLDDANITDIVNLLSYLKPQQTITDGDTLDAYGLDNPCATITATTDGGTTLTLALGNATTDGNSYYMLMNDDPSTVYILSDSLYRYLSISIYDMCRLPELPALTAETLNTVTLSAGDSAVVLTAQRETNQDGSPVADAEAAWRSDGANVTDDATVQALLGELENLAFSKCVDFKPSDQAAALCGLDAPAMSLVATYTADTGTEETLTLAVGSQTLDGAGRYARLGGDTTIYQLDSDAIATLLRVAADGLEP